jgi:hypothetical protein
MVVFMLVNGGFHGASHGGFHGGVQISSKADSWNS